MILVQSTFQRLFSRLDPEPLVQLLSAFFDAKVVGPIRPRGSEGGLLMENINLVGSNLKKLKEPPAIYEVLCVIRVGWG